MKIIANEDLFNRWKQLGENVKFLGAIVQNSTDYPKDAPLEWKRALAAQREAFNTLAEATMAYLVEQMEIDRIPF